MSVRVDQVWQRWLSALTEAERRGATEFQRPSAEQLVNEARRSARAIYQLRFPKVHKFLTWCDLRRSCRRGWITWIEAALFAIPNLMAKLHQGHLEESMHACGLEGSEAVYTKFTREHAQVMKSLVSRANRVDGLLSGKWQWIENELAQECFLMMAVREPPTALRRQILDMLESFVERKLEDVVSSRRAMRTVQSVLEDALQSSQAELLQAPYGINGAKALASVMRVPATQDLAANLASCTHPHNMNERDSWLVLWTALAASVDFAREKSGLREAETARFVAWAEKWQSRMAAWPQEVARVLGVNSADEFGSVRLTIADKAAETLTGADGILVIWDRRGGKDVCRAVSIQAKISSARSLSVERSGWRQFDTLARTAGEHWAAVYMGFNQSSHPLVIAAGVPFKVAARQLLRTEVAGTTPSEDARASDYKLDWLTCGQPFPTALIEALFDPATPCFASLGDALRKIAQTTRVNVWDFLLIQGIGMSARSIERALGADLNLLKGMGFDVSRFELHRENHRNHGRDLDRSDKGWSL